jgi:hypothetical protein
MIRVLLIASLLSALVFASEGLAKNGVVAHLENPGALLAPSGTTISLRWTLYEEKRGFGASGIYLRVRGAVGKKMTAYAVYTAPGHYRARVQIPNGGTRSIQIGLVGWNDGPRGKTRADAFFPIDNDPTRH